MYTDLLWINKLLSQLTQRFKTRAEYWHKNIIHTKRFRIVSIFLYFIFLNENWQSYVLHFPSSVIKIIKSNRYSNEQPIAVKVLIRIQEHLQVM